MDDAPEDTKQQRDASLAVTMNLRPSDFDRSFSLRYSAIADIVQDMRWRWWDVHDEQLPGVAMQDGLPNVTGTVTRALTIHTTSASAMTALERKRRMTEMVVRCTPGPVGQHSATFLFEFSLVGADEPLVTASATMVWIGGSERSLIGRMLARPAPVPQLLHDASQPSPVACQTGCEHISAVSAELDRLRQLANNPQWTYEQESPELRLTDENANQHISSATFIRLAEEAKLRMGGATAVAPVVAVSMDILKEAVATDGGAGYVVRAAVRRSEGIVPHVEWCLFTRARDDLDNAEQLLTRVRLFLSSKGVGRDIAEPEALTPKL